MNSTVRRLIRMPRLLSTVQVIAATRNSSNYSRPMYQFLVAILLIISKADSSQRGYNYTSAMIQWKSFNFTYGTVEFRAKMAGGQGTWSTVWLLGSNCQQTNVPGADNVPPCNWPERGSDEIDSAEIYGGLTTVQQSGDSGSIYSYSASTTDVSQNWHVYQLVWTPDSLKWKIDGVTTHTVTSGVPSTPMFLLNRNGFGRDCRRYHRRFKRCPRRC